MYRQIRPIRLMAVGVLVTLLALLPTLVAGAAPRAAVTRQVTITSTAFSPKTITVNVGDTVAWKNTGLQAQTVTADNGSFDSGNVAPGQTFSHTFTKAGTFTYHDKDHPGMVGTVVVRGPSRLPRTGEGAPDMTGYMLIFAVIALAGGLLLRHRLAQAGR